MSAAKGTFDVIVYDNFHHGDTDERYVHGSFRTYDEALAEARKTPAPYWVSVIQS